MYFCSDGNDIKLWLNLMTLSIPSVSDTCVTKQTATDEVVTRDRVMSLDSAERNVLDVCKDGIK